MIAPPEEFEVIALFRLGYIDPNVKRPAIDWSSTQRKDVAEYVFDERFGTPWRGEGEA